MACGGGALLLHTPSTKGTPVAQLQDQSPVLQSSTGKLLSERNAMSLVLNHG